MRDFDCKKKENRVALVKEVMRVLRVDSKPTKELLAKCIKSLEKRYGFAISKVETETGITNVFVLVPGTRAYSCFRAVSFFELMCKYILVMEKHVKFKERVREFNEL